MTVGMGCKSLEVQTPGNRQFSYPVGAFLQVILFFRLDKRGVPYRTASGAPGFCTEFEKRIRGWHYRTMVTRAFPVWPR